MTRTGDGSGLKFVSLLWANPERAQDIAALHAMLFDPPWSEDSVRALLELPVATSFVAYDGESKQTVGFVLGQFAADEAEILSIGVRPDWQRRGLGRRLVEGLIRAIERAEARSLHLEVAADNTAALALYGRLGFKERGRRAAYYQRKSGPAADALTLVLELPR